MVHVWNSVCYAWRQLRRSPAFTCTVVLTLALGVGANAVVFSVLNALVLRPLPLPQAGRVVYLNRIGNTGSATSSNSQSYPDYRDLRDTNQTFSALAAYRIRRVGIGLAGAVQQGWLYEASENYFDLLGVQPVLGRFFHGSDAHGPDSMPYAVLSYNYWQGRMHGDPEVIGKVIELNKHPFTVLGVAPKTFFGTELFFVPELWVPLLDQKQLEGYSDLEARGDHNSWVIGRLKPGVTQAQAEADLHAVGKRMGDAYTDDKGIDFRLGKPGLAGDTLGRPVRAFLLGVMGLAALVLLAACTNLGSLFAARASDRARELAVRLSLGATRANLVRQLVAEAVLVSLIGGVAGLLGATALLALLSGFHPSPDYPLQVTVTPDLRVFLFALGLSVTSGICFGLVPARQVWRGNAYQVIKSGSAGETSENSWMRWTLKDILLTLQIVLCSVLVTASLVAVRGLLRSRHTALGLQPEGVTQAEFDLRMSGYKQEEAIRFQKQALQQIAALPGVTATGFADVLPLSLSTSDSNVYRDGTTDFRDANAAADAFVYYISPGYLSAAGTRLLAGREFSWHDDDHAPRVALINETLAQKVFGTRDAVGRYFLRGSQRWQVAGVVENGKYQTVSEGPTCAVFFSTARSPDTHTTLLVRSNEGGAATAAAVRSILRSMDPALPVSIGSWTQALNIALFPSLAATAALGVMGGLAAMLAVTGIFGMASYSVSKRMREFGLRVALGAGRPQVLLAALGRPARLLVAGSVCGMTLGALGSRLLAHIVYQASSQDPVVLLGVVVSMALLALLATWLPAQRALRADPAQLLREE